jgi:hypothetical protein
MSLMMWSSYINAENVSPRMLALCLSQYFTTTKLKSGGGWIKYLAAVITAATYSIELLPLSSWIKCMNTYIYIKIWGITIWWILDVQMMYHKYLMWVLFISVLCQLIVLSFINETLLMIMALSVVTTFVRVWAYPYRNRNILP